MDLNIMQILNIKGGVKRDDLIKELQSCDLPIIIYGTGKFARAAAETLVTHGVLLFGFVDRPEYYHKGKTVVVEGNGYPCFSRSDLAPLPEEYALLYEFIDAATVAEEMDFFPGAKIYGYLDGYQPHFMERDFFEENQHILEQLAEDLCDAESCDVLKAYLHSRLTGDVIPLGRLKHDEKYLYDWQLLNLQDHDVFVDGGAFTGDTVKEIEDFTQGRTQLEIFAFEPDTHNLMKLLQNSSVEVLGRLHVMPFGLFDKDEKLSFAANGTMGSALNKHGEDVVSVIALDQHKTFSDVSVIKMDIEGSELAALRGAERLIRKNHPRLAVCIYHRSRDIVDIYQFLQKFEYRFYLRQHAFSAEETVLYAI